MARGGPTRITAVVVVAVAWGLVQAQISGVFDTVPPTIGLSDTRWLPGEAPDLVVHDEQGVRALHWSVDASAGEGHAALGSALEALEVGRHRLRIEVVDRAWSRNTRVWEGSVEVVRSAPVPVLPSGLSLAP